MLRFRLKRDSRFQFNHFKSTVILLIILNNLRQMDILFINKNVGKSIIKYDVSYQHTYMYHVVHT